MPFFVGSYPGLSRLLQACVRGGLCLVLAATGCRSAGSATAKTEGPVVLYSTASDLSGVRLEDVADQAEETVSDVPLTAQLIRRAAEKSKQAVVSIYSRAAQPASSSASVSLGSGFFIHPAGYVLTNHHVIDGVEQVMVQTRGGDDFEATVVAADMIYDLALLRVKDAAGGFAAINMGDSEEVGVGEMTIAIGHPFGLGYSVTFGVISQRERDLPRLIGDEIYHARFIQMDTSIHPGSSGGPLITLSGAWVGVNVAGIPGAPGIGFAVPSSRVRRFLKNVIAGKGEHSKWNH